MRYNLTCILLEEAATLHLYVHVDVLY